MPMQMVKETAGYLVKTFVDTHFNKKRKENEIDAQQKILALEKEHLEKKLLLYERKDSLPAADKLDKKPVTPPFFEEEQNAEYSKYAPEMEVSTGCLPCARAHITAVSASLKEALRFAREDGVDHPEVQTRLALAEEEIVALERYDWTPEKVQRTPAEHQEVIANYYPKLRKLRQDIMNNIDTPDDLERVAAVAGDINATFRMDVLAAVKKRNTKIEEPKKKKGKKK